MNLVAYVINSDWKVWLSFVIVIYNIIAIRYIDRGRKHIWIECSKQLISMFIL